MTPDLFETRVLGAIRFVDDATQSVLVKASVPSSKNGRALVPVSATRKSATAPSIFVSATATPA